MMSKKSNYARNKDWVKDYPFHIILKPQKDELLSSWLTRTALEHGQTLSLFISSYIKHDGTALSRTDIDFKYDEKLFKQLTFKSGLDIKTIRNMSLRSEEGYLFACNDCLYPPKQIRKLVDKRTHYGLMFCPKCLAEDKVPYFRKQWRYSFYNACSKHKIFLVDRCGKCYERIRLTKITSEQSITYCNNCKRDLRLTRPHKVLIKYFYGLEAINWFENGLVNGYFTINSKKILSLWVFQSYTRLQYLLDRGNRLVLDGYPMQEDYKQLCKKLNHYNSKKCEPIYKDFFLSSMVYYLFQNYPHNLVEFSTDNHLTHRDFLHGSKEASFWYTQMIDKQIPVHNTVGREISKFEVLEAIKYLKKIGVHITQKSVAEIIGCHFSINKSFVKIYKRLTLTMS